MPATVDYTGFARTYANAVRIRISRHCSPAYRGLARPKREGFVEIHLDDTYFSVRASDIEALGMHYYRGRFYPTKLWNAFLAGLKIHHACFCEA